MKKALVMAVLGMAMGMPHALAQLDSNGMVEDRAAGSRDGMGVMPDDTNPMPAAADAPDPEAGQTAAPPAPATREPARRAPERAEPNHEATDRAAAKQPDAGQAPPPPATGETGETGQNGQPARAPEHEPEQNARAGETKTEETKTGEAKTGEAKTGEAKTGETKTGETKTEETKTEETKTKQPYWLQGVIVGGLLLLILLLAWALRRSLNRGRPAEAREAAAPAREAAAPRADQAAKAGPARVAAVPAGWLPAGYKIRGGRDYQEDAFLIKSGREGGNRLLLLLADGMGGHVGGARASELAVATFAAHFEQAEGAISGRLRAALEAANTAIAEAVAADPRLSGMGCTVVACLVTGDQAHWISVGDSWLWCLRAGKLTRLNADHSMRPLLENMVELGRMTQAEVEEDPRLGQLRSVVNGEELTLVDQNARPFALRPGDRLLLASDGIEALGAAAIASLAAAREEPAASVNALLDAVEDLKRPGQDNTTVVVYRTPPVGGE